MADFLLDQNCSFLALKRNKWLLLEDEFKNVDIQENEWMKMMNFKIKPQCFVDYRYDIWLYDTINYVMHY